MTIGPSLTLLALLQASTFQGGFVDDVGSETSGHLTRLIIDVPEGALPIRSCKDDCVRASLGVVTVAANRVVFEISVTESRADRIVREEKISGECPASELHVCAGQARGALIAFAAADHLEHRT